LYKSAIACILFAVPLLTGCPTVSGSGTLYLEPNVGSPHVRRVAVVPNRLPANLTNAEYWQERNARMISEEFERRGFDVIDIGVAEAAFMRSGLPLEDTPASRDKYAQLAAELGVDAIVIPYYGTQLAASSIVFSSTISHQAVATLQIFLTEINDFFARIDVSGEHTYTSGYIMMSGLGAMMSSQRFADSGSDALTIGMVGGLGIAMIGLVMDVVVASTSSASKWGDAFDAGLASGLDHFFKRFPAPSDGPRRAPHAPEAPAVTWPEAPPQEPEPVTMRSREEPMDACHRFALSLGLGDSDQRFAIVLECVDALRENEAFRSCVESSTDVDIGGCARLLKVDTEPESPVEPVVPMDPADQDAPPDTEQDTSPEERLIDDAPASPQPWIP